MIPQVGGVSAEEDEVALYQLQKSEMKGSDIHSRLVYSALSLGAQLAADGVLQGFIPTPGLAWMTTDTSTEMRDRRYIRK